MTFSNVTFALDLSLSSPGFAILAVTPEGLPIVLETSHVKTKASKSHGYRLGEISEEIDRYITTYQPEHIVREKGFSRFAATTQALFKVVGVSDLYAHMRMGKVISEIPVTTVKKAVTGSGKADKTEVADAVFRILQIENTDDYHTTVGGKPSLNDDVTDAMAVGLAYMYDHKLIGKGR